MRFNDLFPSKYLSAGDLHGDLVVTMKSLMVEEISGEKKPVLYFRKGAKGVVLNKTNFKMIASLHGRETDDWPGKKIALFPTEADFRGENADVIRIRKRTPAQQDDESASKQSEQAELAF